MISSPSDVPQNRPVDVVILASSAVAFTINAAQTLLSAAHYVRTDLAGCTEAIAQVAQTAGAVSGTKGFFQYTRDLTGVSGWTWVNGEDASGDSTTYVDMGTASQLNTAGWFALDPDACAEVLVRFVGFDGNGSTSYNLRNVRLTCR